VATLNKSLVRRLIHFFVFAGKNGCQKTVALWLLYFVTWAAKAEFGFEVLLEYEKISGR
jgi:hypothetical protein